MADKGKDKRAADQAPNSNSVFAMIPVEEIQSDAEQESFYRDSWLAFWQSKRVIIGVTSAFAVLSIAYALLATEWYRADVLLMPVNSRDAFPAELAGLASLVGVSGLLSDQTSDSTEALALLRSRDFASDFILDMNLMPVLFSDDWNVKTQSWKSDDSEHQPDIRDGIKYFTENVRSVVEDRRTGLVTLSVEWKDPAVAAEWANLLVSRINGRLRERALSEAERNAKYLRSELEKTTLVTLQQSISDLLEHEYETMMLARGTDEYAFRVVDPATVPKWRSRPKRTLIVIMATLAGALLSLLFAIFRYRLTKTADFENTSTASKLGGM